MFLITLAVAVLASSVMAQLYDADDEAWMKAALVVTSFDELSSRCRAGRGFSSADLAKIARWEDANNLIVVRKKVEQVKTDARNATNLQAGVSQLLNAVSEGAIDECLAALTLVNSPDSAFASQGLADQPWHGPGKNGKQVQPEAGPAEVAAAPDAREIDSFGFHSRMTTGVGGFLTTSIYPVVLFRDGSALTDVSGLSDLAISRSATPQKWTEWRRSAGQIELLQKGKWAILSFQKTYPALPAGFRLDGLYRKLSGVGNNAISGESAVSVVSDYRFWPDGTVVRGGSAGGFVSSTRGSVATSNVAANAGGRYRIAGLTLTMDFDDGSQESRIIVADPATDPVKSIWLDGAGYVRR